MDLGKSPVSCLFTGGLGPGGQEELIKNTMETAMSGFQSCWFQVFRNHLILTVQMRTQGPQEKGLS